MSAFKSQNPNLSKWWALYHRGVPAEVSFEPAVASLGRVYRTNHPFKGGKYFGDFVLLLDGVILEVDGESHRRKGAPEADAARDANLLKSGWRTLRCLNEDALSDPYGTVDRLMRDAGLPWRTRKP